MGLPTQAGFTDFADLCAAAAGFVSVLKLASLQLVSGVCPMLQSQQCLQCGHILALYCPQYAICNTCISVHMCILSAHIIANMHLFVLLSLQTLCEKVESQKPSMDYLVAETKALEKQASSDVAKIYKQELRRVQGQWDKLKVKVSQDVHILEEILSKLRLFEVKINIQVYPFFFLYYKSVLLSICMQESK